MARNVFLSFAMEDQRLANAFRAQAKSSRSNLAFRDYSVKEPFERAWKTNAERLIRMSSATICLVGTSTWRSEAVDWEIRKSDALGKQLLAVRLAPGIRRFPPSVEELGVKVVAWDIGEVARALGAAAARATCGWKLSERATPRCSLMGRSSDRSH